MLMTDVVATGIDGLSLQPGSHVCAFYRGAADRDRLLTAYLRAGLDAGDKCISVVDSPQTAEQLESLRHTCSASGHVNGQLDVHMAESTYLAGGGFTAADMLTFWTKSLTTAEDEGYPFCRLVGEMAWALREVPGVEHLVDYEAELNRVTRNHPTIVLCLYDLGLFSGEVIVDIIKTHPQVLVQGMILRVLCMDWHI